MAKKLPFLRRCVTCRDWAPKLELIRVARDPTGIVQLDISATLQGRGAYLHRSGSCISEALRKRHLERALRQPIPAEVLRELAALVSEFQVTNG